ncbi:MAG TPA: hypothetical protein VM689_04075 [Aliidongia sp.]|nr:hypothetical protein [Aliidongia sp.]
MKTPQYIWAQRLDVGRCHSEVTYAVGKIQVSGRAEQRVEIMKTLIRPAIVALVLALGGCVAYPAPVAYGPAPGYYYPDAYGTVVIGGGGHYGHRW